MDTYEAGFFGFILCSVVTGIKVFYFSEIGQTMRASDKLEKIEINVLEQQVKDTIAHRESFNEKFNEYISGINIESLIYNKCKNEGSLMRKKCHKQLRNIFSVITIDHVYPGWRQVCETYHNEPDKIYECIRNFRVNKGWTYSKNLSKSDNDQIFICMQKAKNKLKECF